MGLIPRYDKTSMQMIRGMWWSHFTSTDTNPTTQLLTILINIKSKHQGRSSYYAVCEKMTLDIVVGCFFLAIIYIFPLNLNPANITQ